VNTTRPYFLPLPVAHEFAAAHAAHAAVRGSQAAVRGSQAAVRGSQAAACGSRAGPTKEKQQSAWDCISDDDDDDGRTLNLAPAQWLAWRQAHCGVCYAEKTEEGICPRCDEYDEDDELLGFDGEPSVEPEATDQRPDLKCRACNGRHTGRLDPHGFHFRDVCQQVANELRDERYRCRGCGKLRPSKNPGHFYPLRSGGFHYDCVP
jgi:hypothetical protein